MEYDEIDQYVDQLFNRPEGGGEGEPPKPPPPQVIRITPEIRQQSEAAVENVKRVIAEEGAKPVETGKWKSPLETNEALRPTGYRPDTTGVSMSLERNGYPQAQAAGQARDSRGIGLAGVLLAILACVGSCAFMAFLDGTISLVH